MCSVCGLALVLALAAQPQLARLTQSCPVALPLSLCAVVTLLPSLPIYAMLYRYGKNVYCTRYVGLRYRLCELAAA